MRISSAWTPSVERGQALAQADIVLLAQRRELDVLLRSLALGVRQIRHPPARRSDRPQSSTCGTRCDHRAAASRWARRMHGTTGRFLGGGALTLPTPLQRDHAALLRAHALAQRLDLESRAHLGVARRLHLGEHAVARRRVEDRAGRLERVCRARSPCGAPRPPRRSTADSACARPGFEALALGDRRLVLNGDAIHMLGPGSEGRVVRAHVVERRRGLLPRIGQGATSRRPTPPGASRRRRSARSTGRPRHPVRPPMRGATATRRFRRAERTRSHLARDG